MHLFIFYQLQIYNKLTLFKISIRLKPFEDTNLTFNYRVAKSHLFFDLTVQGAFIEKSFLFWKTSDFICLYFGENSFIGLFYDFASRLYS